MNIGLKRLGVPKKDGPRTTIIAVAHRLETIMSFDKVVVFDVGKVVETGTVEQLKKANGAFTRMLKAQFEVF